MSYTTTFKMILPIESKETDDSWCSVDLTIYPGYPQTYWQPGESDDYEMEITTIEDNRKLSSEEITEEIFDEVVKYFEKNVDQIVGD